MQRLFSTFANGWPGRGLFIQRFITGVVLLHNGFALLKEVPGTDVIIPEAAGAALGLFIMAGLWTPVVGLLVAAAEFWIIFAGGSDLWVSFLLAVLGGSLAMIGPGAWSIDARLFGRKHFGS